MSSPIATPVVAAVGLRPRLTALPRPVTVLAAFPKAVYLRVQPEDPTATEPIVVALVTADGVAHPNALVLTSTVTDRPLRTAHRGDRGELGAGALHLGGRAYRPARWRDAAPSLHRVEPGALRANAAALEAAVRDGAGLPPADLTDPLARVAAALGIADADAATAAARQLLGRGPGLTPAGDDLLAGLFAGLRGLAPVCAPSDVAARLTATTLATGEAVIAAAVGRTTDISVALLRHALAGEVAAPAAHVLRRLAATTANTDRGEPGGPHEALAALLAVGSTSGRDLATGLARAGATVAAAAGRRVAPTAA